MRLLEHLAHNGFTVSHTKLHLCKTEVKCLGFLLSKGQRWLSDSQIVVVKRSQLPATKQAVLACLGLINYCRQWIPDCSYCDKQLRAIVEHSDPLLTPVTHTPQIVSAFERLKTALCSSPGPGLPDYTKLFHLYTHEHSGVASGLLAQEHGGGFHLCAHLSKTLDSMAAGLPACLRAVAVSALLVSDAEQLVLSHPLVLHTTHQLKQVLSNIETQHMTAQCRSGYETILCATANLTIKMFHSPRHHGTCLTSSAKFTE